MKRIGAFLFVFLLVPMLAHAQMGKVISTAPIKSGDCVQGATSPVVADSGNPCPLPAAAGVQTFNGRSGPNILPQAGDYAAFYAPLGQTQFVGASMPVTPAQFFAWNPFIVTASGVTLSYPASSTLNPNGGSAILTAGGTATIQANAADVICANASCGLAGGSLSLAGGQMFWVFSDGKGHLYVGF